MPPDKSPLGIYLENVKKQFKKQPQLKQQKYFYPKNSIKNLGSKPTPFNFYTYVLVYDFDPKNMYPHLACLWHFPLVEMINPYALPSSSPNKH